MELGISVEVLFVIYLKATQPMCLLGEWSDFFDADDPGGVNGGDFELVQGCNLPSNIHARLLTGAPVESSGEVVHFNLGAGFKCVDSEQTDGSCSDYEVRFCCDEDGGYLFVQYRVVANVTLCTVF